MFHRVSSNMHKHMCMSSKLKKQIMTGLAICGTILILLKSLWTLLDTILKFFRIKKTELKNQGSELENTKKDIKKLNLAEFRTTMYQLIAKDIVIDNHTKFLRLHEYLNEHSRPGLAHKLSNLFKKEDENRLPDQNLAEKGMAMIYYLQEYAVPSRAMKKTMSEMLSNEWSASFLRFNLSCIQFDLAPEHNFAAESIDKLEQSLKSSINLRDEVQKVMNLYSY